MKKNKTNISVNTYRSRINNPQLLIGPLLQIGLQDNEPNYKEPHAEKQKIKLVLPGASQNESNLLTHGQNVSVKVDAYDKVHYGV